MFFYAVTLFVTIRITYILLNNGTPMRSKALFIVSLMIFGGAMSIPFMNDSTLHLDSEIPATQSSSGLDQINATLSASEGSNLGGYEITISGTGFTDLAFNNITTDGTHPFLDCFNS